ncbi:MAG: GvpL/GvpF family gas vesicle protein [Acidobacteriaceae bacterium]
MKPSELAYYLYCLTPSGRELHCAATGVEQRHPVLLSVCEEACAVYSEVVLGEFAGESAEANMQDLAWLGPRVCRHESVIEQIMSQTPILPARFATLFSSLDSLRQFVVEHRAAIAKFFAALGNKQEWAIKGLLDRAGALDGLFHPAAQELTGSPGTRYFQEKRIKAQLQREFDQRLREFSQRAATALATHAVGFRERKVLTPVAEGSGAEIVLNWALLIPPEAFVDFNACLKRFNGGDAFPGLMLTLSGPWPPYSFAPDLSGGTGS